jgi:hypothetical protein
LEFRSSSGKQRSTIHEVIGEEDEKSGVDPSSQSNQDDEPEEEGSMVNYIKHHSAKNNTKFQKKKSSMKEEKDQPPSTNKKPSNNAGDDIYGRLVTTNLELDPSEVCDREKLRWMGFELIGNSFVINIARILTTYDYRKYGGKPLIERNFRPKELLARLKLLSLDSRRDIPYALVAIGTDDAELCDSVDESDIE